MSKVWKGIVLLVEDDPDLSELISVILRREGYRVVRAANGRQALDALRVGLPHVILLDMKMPVMNGWEFAREFRKHHDHLAPIIVVTAAADARSRAEEIGADDWLGKPFELSTLLRIVERHVAYDEAPGARRPEQFHHPGNGQAGF